MSRPFALSILVFVLLAAKAGAIEMFTNFNNGMNVGFPPMEVPISVYRGFGHGGWNPYAEGMPLKTVPPVPAMMPTGQVPHHWVPQSTRMPHPVDMPQSSAMPNGDQSQTGMTPADDTIRLASGRRARWQRGGYRPTADNAGGNDRTAAPDGASPTLAKPNPSEMSPPTVLHAETDTLRAAPALKSVKSKVDDFTPGAAALFPQGS